MKVKFIFAGEWSQLCDLSLVCSCFTSFYVSAMCYSGDFLSVVLEVIISPQREAIKVDLNKAKLNEFTPSTLKYVNFLSSQNITANMRIVDYR